MSGRVINVDYSPFAGDMFGLWTRVADCLRSEFGLDGPSDGLAGLEYLEDEDEWVTGEGFDPSQFNLAEFIQLNLGVVLDCSIRSQSTELYSQISLYRYPPKPRGVPCLSVSFGTILDRQLFPDVAQMKAEEKPKRALVQFCQSLAHATQASAFMVYTDDNARLKPVLPEQLIQRLLSWPESSAGAEGVMRELETPPQDRVGDYNGVSRKLLPLQTLEASWGPRPAIHELPSGFVILDLL
ncbi:MAG: hypothetical protein ABW123_16410 [Cystobacter sp.]